MKFSDEAMKVALESFMEDDFWRKIYEGASEIAKKRLRVAFWYCKYMRQKEDLHAYRKYRDAVEREMTYEDAAYLAEHFPEGAGKEHYAEMRDRLELAPLKSKEKLDAAIEVMLEGWSDCDRVSVSKTQKALEACKGGWPRYEWVWGAVGGNGDDCELLGDAFEHGHGVEPNDDLAFFWFRRGALCGCGDSCCRLAEIYEREGARFDVEKAKFWFGEGLRRGNNSAKIDLGARLTTWEEGPWVEFKNPELGVRLLWMATKGDHSGRAHYFLGKCHEQGVGVEWNLLEAYRHYRLAAQKDVCGADEAVSRVRKLRLEEKKSDRERAEALAAAFGLPYMGDTEVGIARKCCRITKGLERFADGGDGDVLAAVREYLRKQVDESE